MKRGLLAFGLMGLSSLFVAQDMPLSQVLIPDEKWQLMECMFGFTDAPTADDKGNMYLSDMNDGLYRISHNGVQDLFIKPIPGISGMKFANDSNIIIRGGEHEHHANYFPWLRLGGKIDVRSLPVDENGGFTDSDFKKMLDKKTKLVALSHGLYNSGLILPVMEIGEQLQKQNIPYFLDTAQTVGCIGDYDFANTGCDFMSFNGSKWLCGPMGTGVFYCKRESSDLLEPLSIGGESAETDTNNELAYKELPDKFQTGFRNYVGLAGMVSSVTLLQNFGLDNIRKHIIKLSNLFIDEIGKISESRVFGPENEAERTSIVSFEIGKSDPEKIVSVLAEKGIIIAKREIYEKPVLRISPHVFNTENEILRLVEELKKL